MQRLKTFIVEDSPIIREGLVETLEEFTPVQVVGTAADERSALQWLSDDEHACDLMIIDIFLRAGSGLAVLKMATQSGLTGKRVVLTNYATEDMRRTCAELGADRVFDKSRELEELIAYCSKLRPGVADTAPDSLR